MHWQKLGLVYDAQQHPLPWAQNSALTPTPILLNEQTIRVYFAARDAKGVAKIRFVDLDANDPTKILSVSQPVSLDVGAKGCFDDNGVILGDVLKHQDAYYMFYVGFQLVEKVKFLAFTGLAKSEDGVSFHRQSNTPLMDRADEGYFIRAIHSVLYENGLWRIWYSVGSDWQMIDGKPYPIYHIKYCETTDLNAIPKQGTDCFLPQGREYRIGRPRIYHFNNRYHAHFTFATLDGGYTAGYAWSEDGLQWSRDDSQLGIHLSDSGWDSMHLCYPTLLSVKDKTYMFYNGNNMGENGFGVAVLTP